MRLCQRLLKDFKLIGKIEKGKFVKISSKGDFGGGNYLDIKMKNDKKNKKNTLKFTPILQNHY